MKIIGLSGLMLALLSSAVAHSANIWLEAETGAEYNPIVVKSDLGASEAIYLGSWKWADYASRSDDDGKISFTVYIQEAGDYTLWARVRAPWDGIRPYDVSFGSGDSAAASDWQSWAPDNRSEAALKAWGWSDSGISQYLSTGSHTFYMVQREGGPNLHLDKVLLTNDSSYVPSGMGLIESTLDIENPYRSNTVEKYGQLRLVGNKLSDKNGNPMQLQGISAHGLQWFPLVENQTIPYLAEYFGAEAVRLAMYIEDYAPTDPSDFWGGYTANKSLLLANTEKAIDDAVNAGMYVLVDWHIHNTPGKYTEQAKEFFTYISRKYGHLPNIIYEICNEPVSVSWSSGIKPYAETIIAAIRANDPDNIIIVGTPNWSQDVDAAAQDPLTASNIMYAFHYYAATHDFNTMKNKVQTAMNAGLAIFVSEWGSSDVGTSSTNLTVAKQWMDFMTQNQLSWINWSLGNKDEASSILKPTAPLSGPWVDSDLTVPGKWLKPYFDAPTAANGAQTSTGYASVSAIVTSSSRVVAVSSAQNSSAAPVITSVSSSVASSPATPSTITTAIEAENYQVVAGSVQVEGQSLAYFDSGDKVMYSNVDFTGVSALKLRYATEKSGTFELRIDSVNGSKILSYTTQATGSWSNYVEVTVNLEAAVSGVHNLYLIGVSGDGIMNLDKISLLKSGTVASSSSSVASSSKAVAVSSVVSVATSSSSSALSDNSIPAVNIVNGVIQGEDYSKTVAGSVTPLSNALGLIDQGDVIMFKGVNLSGINAMMFTYATATSGTFELRIDSSNGTKLLSHTTRNTNDYLVYTDVLESFTTSVSGVHDLYLVVVSGARIMNLDKMKLLSGSAAAQQVTIEAENFNQVAAGSVQSVGMALGYMDAGDAVAYYNIDLTGVKTIKLIYATPYSGMVEFHIDNAYGTKIATHYTQSTGSFDNYAERTISLSTTISGTRNLYLTGISGSGIFNLDKIVLIK